MKLVEFILYVEDQEKSRQFYEDILKIKPALHVPGMTEFEFSAHCKLGLMPNNGIAQILSGRLPHPKSGFGIPRCELYLYVDNVDEAYEHALQNGAQPVNQPASRDWGDRVGYLADPDGHVIAFAAKDL